MSIKPATRVIMDALSIAHHLAVAAETYERDAVQLRTPDVGDAAQESLAKQFDRQAKEAREWSEAIYNHDGLAVDGDRFVAIEVPGSEELSEPEPYDTLQAPR